jgi:hypothetical protein
VRGQDSTQELLGLCRAEVIGGWELVNAGHAISTSAFARREQTAMTASEDELSLVERPSGEHTDSLRVRRPHLDVSDHHTLGRST